jgi:glycine/serine hydroxymethyltransferase
MGVAEMVRVAGLIDEVLQAPEDTAVLERVHGKVRALAAEFPLYPAARVAV